MIIQISIVHPTQHQLCQLDGQIFIGHFFWTVDSGSKKNFLMLHVDYFAHLLVDHGQLFIGTDTDPRAKISCQACVMLGLKVSNPIISYEIVHARSHFTLSSLC